MNDLLGILTIAVMFGSLVLTLIAANKRAASAEARELTYRALVEQQAEAMRQQSEAMDALMTATENMKGAMERQGDGIDALMASLATVEAQRDRFLEQLTGQR